MCVCGLTTFANVRIYSLSSLSFLTPKQEEMRQNLLMGHMWSKFNSFWLINSIKVQPVGNPRVGPHQFNNNLYPVPMTVKDTQEGFFATARLGQIRTLFCG
jgi:hypothetical protein